MRSRRHTIVLQGLLFICFLLVAARARSLVSLLVGEDSIDQFSFLIPILHSLPWIFGGMLIDSLFKAVVLQRLFLRLKGREAPRLLANLFSALVQVVVVVGIIAVAFNESVTSLVATSGLVTIIIGIALRELIADFFSGLAINIERPYDIGDWLEVERNLVAKVIEINWRATRLLTQSHKLIVVPNRLLAAKTLVNFSAPDPKYREKISLVLGNEHDPKRIENILHAAVLATPETLSGEPHRIRIDGFNERGTIWEVKFWIDGYAKRVPAVHNVCANIVTFLRAAGVEVPYSRLESLNLGQSLAELHESSRERNVRRVLERIELLSAFTSQELDHLESVLKERRLAGKQVVVRENEVGDSMFILVEGLLEASREEDEESSTVVGRIQPGEVFGEMSLLTGAPRQATVTALLPSVALELTADEVRQLLTHRPALAESLGHIMDRRSRATAAARTALEQARTADQEVSTQHWADRIRAFFRLLGA